MAFVGKRKCSVANVILTSGDGNIVINGKNSVEYFQGNPRFLKIICSPLVLLGVEKSFNINVDAWGGGLGGQADAVKLGVSKALLESVSESDKLLLRSNGFLTRNSLVKERRKYGLKKARKASQFSKR